MRTITYDSLMQVSDKNTSESSFDLELTLEQRLIGEYELYMAIYRTSQLPEHYDRALKALNSL